MRRTILTALLATVYPLCASPVKIHGYITNISSPASFDIDDYRITRDDSLVFELDKGDYPDITFRTVDLRVGTELDVQGELNDSTHELHATSIKVFVNDTLRVKRSTVIEHAAVLQREGSAWKGVIHADGQTIKVDSQTHLILKEWQTNQITPGLSITYEGRRERDGSIAATKLEIFANDTGAAELKMWRDIKPKLDSNGEISIRGVKYKLVPDAEAQSFVQRTGAKLVPSVYQHDLSNGAARGLPFQFYLIENPDFNAHAFPNGTVLVNSGVFRLLTSEAQLAAVLGHEIAHATQQHAFRETQHPRKLMPAFLSERSSGSKAEPAGNSYSRVLENQADRVGLEYMMAAGYDPREAAEVWKELAKLAAGDKNVFWNSQEDVTSRRSYLLAEIRNTYSSIDFQSYVRDREEFDVLAERFGNTAIAERAPAAPVKPTADANAQPRPGYQKPRTLAVSEASNRISTGADNSGSLTQNFVGNAVTINSGALGRRRGIERTSHWQDALVIADR